MLKIKMDFFSLRKFLWNNKCTISKLMIFDTAAGQSREKMLLELKSNTAQKQNHPRIVLICFTNVIDFSVNFFSQALPT